MPVRLGNLGFKSGLASLLHLQEPYCITIISTKSMVPATTDNHSGRNKTARSLENVERVRRSIQRNGRVSWRRNGLEMSRSTFNRIVHELHLHPYVLVERQALLPNDPAERINFCNWLLAKTNEDPGFLGNLISSDEAIFSLNSEANTKNEVQYSRYGNAHPEDHYVERAQGAVRVMVWLGLMGNGNVLGSHFVQ